MSKKGTAYVLSGGGAKGSYQVGAMLTLYENGVRPEAIYGTSVGALNAYGYATVGMEKLLEHWCSIKSKKEILSLNIWKLLTRQAKGVYSMKPLREWLERIYQDQPICEAVACMVDMCTGSIAYWSMSETKRKFIDHVLASSCIPFIMEPVIDSMGIWIDGGARERAPLQKAVEDGYKDIYVILCNPIGQNMADGWNGKHEVDFALRAVDVLQYDVMETDIKVIREMEKRPDLSIKVLSPSELLIDTLEFDHNKILDNILLGRREAKYVIK